MLSSNGNTNHGYCYRTYPNQVNLNNCFREMRVQIHRSLLASSGLFKELRSFLVFFFKKKIKKKELPSLQMIILVSTSTGTSRNNL